MLGRLVAMQAVVLLVVQGSISGTVWGAEGSGGTFNVRNYGATGRKSDVTIKALQKAIDACAESGGGEVYAPMGDYTSGTLHLHTQRPKLVANPVARGLILNFVH